MLRVMAAAAAADSSDGLSAFWPCVSGVLGGRGGEGGGESERRARKGECESG